MPFFMCPFLGKPNSNSVTILQYNFHGYSNFYYCLTKFANTLNFLGFEGAQLKKKRRFRPKRKKKKMTAFRHHTFMTTFWLLPKNS